MRNTIEKERTGIKHKLNEATRHNEAYYEAKEVLFDAIGAMRKSAKQKSGGAIRGIARKALGRETRSSSDGFRAYKVAFASYPAIGHPVSGWATPWKASEMADGSSEDLRLIGQVERIGGSIKNQRLALQGRLPGGEIYSYGVIENSVHDKDTENPREYNSIRGVDQRVAYDKRIPKQKDHFFEVLSNKSNIIQPHYSQAEFLYEKIEEITGQLQA